MTEQTPDLLVLGSHNPNLYEAQELWTCAETAHFPVQEWDGTHTQSTAREQQTPN